MKKTNTNKGFTLVELIIVIAILAVIAAIAAPNLINNINNARKKTDVTNARSIAEAAIQVIAEDETIAASITTAGATFAVNGDTAVAAPATLLEKTIAKLQKGPSPKYESGKNFDVTVSTTGQVTVSVNGSQLYPTPVAKYEN